MDHIYLINCFQVMFDMRRRLFFFACLYGAAGATLKRQLRLSATTNKKIGSGYGTALKVAASGGSGSAAFKIVKYV